ncbi:MAG: DUF1579 domain-containing protein [Planctomycetota bacterium]
MITRLHQLTFAFTLLFAAATVAQEEMPKPGPEHEKLAASAGTWDATMVSQAPDGTEMTTKGVSVQKMTLGGFWLVDDFSADFMGMPFTGHGMTGYDPIKGKYVATWMDSMSPFLMLMEGNYDATGKVLTMTGNGVGMDGQPAKYRNVSTFVDADTTTFEMYVTGADGKEAKMMTITYKRRAAKGSEKKEH